MSNRSTKWLSQRGQADAASAIDLVLTQQPEAHETIQMIADELIEDSPYQARQTMLPAELNDLVSAMRSAGFQGVLIVRPHPDLSRQRRGQVQLVFGHRRRTAWRTLCTERAEACRIPVIVRAISDEQLLLIGAQENLQRHDLDPVEEGQLVHWMERMFPQHNQAELGNLLGKSADWVSTRSRIHRLPSNLKDGLHKRPRAISQFLELGSLAATDPTTALEIAERVVSEQLTLDMVRSLVRGYNRPESVTSAGNATEQPRRGTATIVKDSTSQTASQPPHEGIWADSSASMVEPQTEKCSLAKLTESPHHGEVQSQMAVLVKQAARLLEQATLEQNECAKHEEVDMAIAACEDAIRQIRATQQQ